MKREQLEEACKRHGVDLRTALKRAVGLPVRGEAASRRAEAALVEAGWSPSNSSASMPGEAK
jgi:hypothetical protein